ncbi:MAG: nucleoside hydrolase [Veillonella caviae]|nr:nucleoside hydrolase [Veillonella caviae]
MAPIHDALAIAYLMDPSVITELVDANVDIDISGGLCDGRMVADIHNTKKFKDSITAKVALNADADKFVQILKENLGKSNIENK